MRGRWREGPERLGCTWKILFSPLFLTYSLGRNSFKLRPSGKRSGYKGVIKRRAAVAGGGLTLRSQACAWTRCGLRTGSDTGTQQTRRPCRRRPDGTRSGCRHGPVDVPPASALGHVTVSSVCVCLCVCAHLHVEQVELDGVPGVHVLVRVEELPPQQQHLALLHALLPQRPAVVQPVHCTQHLPSETDTSGGQQTASGRSRRHFLSPRSCHSWWCDAYARRRCGASASASPSSCRPSAESCLSSGSPWSPPSSPRRCLAPASTRRSW